MFTSIPVAEAVAIITEKLEADDTLKERTNMSPKNVASLLEFCLTNTYFQFRDNIYQQKQGAAMGSPVSPIVANLYMEAFEQQALTTAPTPPSFYGRYMWMILLRK